MPPPWSLPRRCVCIAAGPSLPASLVFCAHTTTDALACAIHVALNPSPSRSHLSHTTACRKVASALSSTSYVCPPQLQTGMFGQ
jgi:hypothetical protein